MTNQKCDTCFIDHGRHTYATHQIPITEWSKGKCEKFCTPDCTIIHDPVVEKIYYFCKKHYHEFNREMKAIDL